MPTARKTAKRKTPKKDQKLYVNVGLQPEVHRILVEAAEMEYRTHTQQAALFLTKAAREWEAEQMGQMVEQAAAQLAPAPEGDILTGPDDGEDGSLDYPPEG